MSPELKADWSRLIAAIEGAITAQVEGWKGIWPDLLTESSAYALNSGGKRVRPVLALMAAEAISGDHTAAMPWALALEYIHNYSLVHDDLPCMDNDEMRRGRPTTWKVYGEGQAALVGDALLTEAFGLVGRMGGHHVGRLVTLLSECAGGDGMVGGQVLDIREPGPADLASLEHIHNLKTGALFRAAMEGGALCAGADEGTIEAMARYGRAIGLLFQITDDVLDAEQDAEANGRSYLHHLPMNEVIAHRDHTAHEAKAAIAHLGEGAAPLSRVVDFITHREI